MAIPADETPAPVGRPLAIYQPSRVIGDSRHLTLLHSPDSVRDIYDFYTAELERNGWITTSQVISGASATLVARRGPHGATISINHTGTGTAVSIGSY
jgi:hypothetical protein